MTTPSDIFEDSRTDKEVVAAKLQLLLDLTNSDDARNLAYEDIHHELSGKGIGLSKTRWLRLLSGSPVNRWDPDLLTAIAALFDIGEDYLLKRDAELPETFAVHLPLIAAQRLKEVEQFTIRALSEVDLSAVQRIVGSIRGISRHAHDGDTP